MQRIEVPWDAIGALSLMKSDDRARFQVASDGSYLRWPQADVHLDIEALRIAVDPTAAEAAQLRHQARSHGFGRAVRELRRQCNIPQGSIPGLSARHVRRIERAEAFPRTSTIEKLANAHGVDLTSYLDRLAVLQR